MFKISQKLGQFCNCLTKANENRKSAQWIDGNFMLILILLSRRGSGAAGLFPPKKEGEKERKEMEKERGIQKLL